MKQTPLASVRFLMKLIYLCTILTEISLYCLMGNLILYEVSSNFVKCFIKTQFFVHKIYDSLNYLNSNHQFPSQFQNVPTSLYLSNFLVLNKRNIREFLLVMHVATYQEVSIKSVIVFSITFTMETLLRVIFINWMIDTNVEYILVLFFLLRRF